MEIGGYFDFFGTFFTSAWCLRAHWREIDLWVEVEKFTVNAGPCRACGRPTAAIHSRGRPVEYCSPQCRRVLELRRRAWDEELSKLERACLYHDGFSTDETRAAAARERDHFLAHFPRP